MGAPNRVRVIVHRRVQYPRTSALPCSLALPPGQFTSSLTRASKASQRRVLMWKLSPQAGRGPLINQFKVSIAAWPEGLIL